MVAVRTLLARTLDRVGLPFAGRLTFAIAVLGAVSATVFALAELTRFAQVAAALAIFGVVGALIVQVRALRRRAQGLQKRSEGLERRLEGQIRQLRGRVRDLEKAVMTQGAQIGEVSTSTALEARVTDAVLTCRAWSWGLHNSLPDLDSALCPAVVDRLIDAGEMLTAFEVLRRNRSLGALAARSLRHLRRELRFRGYLRSAEEAARELVSRSSKPSDRRALERLQAEIAVLSGAHVPSGPPLEPITEPVMGRVLHIVGRSLPEHQTGYTIRTHQIARAQARRGLDVHVVTRTGVGAEQGETPTPTVIDDVTYHRLSGPSTREMILSEWLDLHCERLGELVAHLRPSVLHAASDYVNALAARSVGQSACLPVIYESRGFWEETWLSRQATKYGWSDLARLGERHGLPDVYVWRRDMEDRLRAATEHVVTLDDEMQARICQGGTPAERVTIVPNAVDTDDFPVPERDEQLAIDLGIGPDTLVVGYISSLVEYEGIDDLVTAFHRVRTSRPGADIHLLVVGDGAVREQLEAQVDDLGLDDATFTGRVPHADVLRYYSLIDIFVVPRKPVEVCHLVTPLKPYEALATERTVVLSNVRALANIARRSGAAELFEAGDPSSLAGVLTQLIDAPSRRRELSERGRHWVHEHHTWASNARIYEAIYADLTAELSNRVAATQSTRDTDPARARRQIEQLSERPLEPLYRETQEPDDILNEGWVLGGFPAVKVGASLDWIGASAGDRSWNFHLHSWDFMEPVLRRYGDQGDTHDLAWAAEVALSWGAVFGDGDAHGTMAWYDMALSLRAYRLAYLAEQAVRSSLLDDETTRSLLLLVHLHREKLLEEAAFKGGSNHGVYTALGALALARRFPHFEGMDRLAEVSRQRLHFVTERQFLGDGGHAEHSPDYHRMLLDTYSRGLDVDLLDDDQLRKTIERAEEALGWFIQPDGRLVQIGDTPARSMIVADPFVSSPTTIFLQTRGRQGKPNDTGLFTLPDAGYAFVRSPQPQDELDHEASAYLSLFAGFHSRSHKHADDLSITWFDRGQEILIDAGRYGYVDLLPKDSPLRLEGFYYSAPERQYVESTPAHNTVQVDGVDHARRGRKPYGSGIESAEERDGHFHVSGRVDHGHWTHSRRVVLLPHRWLLVVDNVDATDGSDHRFDVWWNLSGVLDPRPSEAGSCALSFDLPGSTERLWMRGFSGADLVPPATGQRDPLRGWRSQQDREFTPATSVGYRAGGERHTFVTLLAFGKECPTDVPPHPFGGVVSQATCHDPEAR